ncbi:zonadhesin-like isoform X2 [Halichondria panicea]|uniref:zonadhesin-like isoform X2 n=1 Tax=Halichondria panicea TaxID=6063 RepID=UPI00312BC543
MASLALSMASLQLCVLLSLTLLPFTLQTEDCTNDGRGKVYQSCGSPCTLTCENYMSPPFCLASCSEGCFCPDGTVEHNGDCILTSDCPTESTAIPPSPSSSINTTTLVCPAGKIHTMCGPRCHVFCGGRRECQSRNCVEGCFCDSDMVELGETCVRPEDCPVPAESTTAPPSPSSSTNTTTLVCPAGKIHTMCGPRCHVFCGGRRECQSRNCVEGCFCDSDMVELGETCVRPEDCPVLATESTTAPPSPSSSTNTTTLVCPAGKIHTMCGPRCHVFCGGRRECQSRNCVEGCFCDSDMVELGETCVRPEDCPVPAESTTAPPSPSSSTNTTTLVCPAGKIHTMCGPRCHVFCGGRRECQSRNCVEGCFCDSDMVELGETCVRPEDCPVLATESTTAPPSPSSSTNTTTLVCPAGKIHTMCGPRCHVFCGGRRECQSRNCVEGCFCDSDMVELGETCVRPEDCPVPAESTTAPPSPSSSTNTTTLVCPAGKIHTMCGPRCHVFCGGRRECQSRNCVEGCFCDSDMVELGETCVRPEDCPVLATESTTAPSSPSSSTNTTTLVCPAGKIHTMCGPRCHVFCGGRRECQSRNCVEGCFCDSDMVELGETCVRPEDCPVPATESTTAPPSPSSSTNTTTLVCPAGKIHTMCGPRCHVFCGGRRECQSRNCVEGCFCDSDMVELGETCVRPEDCPVLATESTTAPSSPSSSTNTTTLVCPAGKIHTMCGPRCHVFCGGRRECQSRNCVEGCFCDSDMVELGETCVRPEDCPVPATESTTAPPSPSSSTNNTTLVCPAGKIHTMCGPRCHVFCGGRRECQSRNCVEGCFCDSDMVELGETCVRPEDCPVPATESTTAPPSPSSSTNTTTPVCPAGKIYTMCGPRCHVFCGGRRECQSRNCVEGCFCDTDMVEFGETCVRPEDCPAPATTLMPPTISTTTSALSPLVCTSGKEYRQCGPVCKDTCGTLFGNQPKLCFSLRCFAGCFCPEGTIEHEGQCIKSTACPNYPCQYGRCPNGYRCEVDPQSRQSLCKRSLYVPCDADVSLACDSAFLRCVVENTTRYASCVPSCYLNNGNCDSDQTCIVQLVEHGSTVHCLNFNDLSTECPPGMIMDQCGSLCQETCDDVNGGGIKACPLICGPAACVCPYGLVRYRDRCVDPKECYSLEKYPPNIFPLPSARADTGLLQLSFSGMTKVDFATVQDTFLSSLDEILSEHTGVEVELHAVLESDGGLELYIMVSGGDVSSETLNYYADLISSAAWSIPIDDVVVIELPQVGRLQEGLSQLTIVGIAVAVVVIFVLLVALVIVSLCYCTVRRRQSVNKGPQKLNPLTYSRLVNEGMG